MEKKLEICDFCGKSQKEVEKIIKGAKACICNECISVCCEILEEEGVKYRSHASAKCCFCGKSKDEVVKLIAGPDCYICNECVQKIGCAALLSSDVEGVCSFCGKNHDEVKILAEKGHYKICNECMELCKEILLEEELSQSDKNSLKCSNCCKDITDADNAVSIGNTILCKACIEKLYKTTQNIFGWWK